MRRSRKLWESLGASDPYFAVATYEKFLSANLDENSKEEFFNTGREYLERVWCDFESSFGARPRPKRSLDFGCGVGRVLLALAERSESVTGVDISEAMISETAHNCDIRGVRNIELLQSTDFFRQEQTFDLIHSVIVLQHIHPKLGIDIIRRLIGMLEAGGIGMLHVTYHDPSSTVQKIKNRIRGHLGFLRPAIDKAFGVECSRWMPMHIYDINEVLRLLQESGCHNIAIRFSDHGVFGAMIFLQKAGKMSY